MKKRAISLLLCLALGVSVCACGKGKEESSDQPSIENKDEEEAEDGDDSENQEEQVATVEVEPVMDLSEKVTITWSLPTQQSLSLEETPMFKAIEEKLNIDIELTEMPVDQYAEKKKLNIASKEYPDIMTWTSGSEANEYGPLGAFLELSQYLDYMPSVKEKVEAVTAESKNEYYTIYNMDDKIYMIPHYRVNPIPQFDFSYNKAAFEAVGVTSLETWDDVYEGLKKIKEANPDQYPVGFRNLGGVSMPLQLFVTSFTGAKASTLSYTGYDYDTNEYMFALDVPGYKEAVAFFAKLYTEELIHPEYTLMDLDMLQNLIKEEEVVMIADYVGGLTAKGAIMEQIDHKLTPLATPQAEGQDAVIGSAIPAFDSSVGSIINQNVTSDPVKLGRCLMFLDYVYSEEFFELQWFHPDVTTYNDDGTYTYKDVVYDAADEGYTQMMETYFLWSMSANFQDAMEELPALDSGYYEYRETHLRGEESKDKYKPSPTVPFTQEEQQEVNTLTSAVNDRFIAGIAEFAEGKRSMDEWETFSNELKEAGGEELISLYNEALKRLG